MGGVVHSKKFFKPHNVNLISRIDVSITTEVESLAKLEEDMFL